MILYKASDTVIQWDGLKSARTGSYINSATVTFTIKDEDDNALTGATNVTMSYVSGTNGRYQGILQDTVSLGNPGTKYFCELTATSVGYKATRRISCVVQYKGAS